MWDWSEKVELLKRSSTPATLVTVAGVEGSAPRETGAKMIVLEDGTFFGTIGGGNLEMQAIEQAKDFLRNGTTQSVKYPLGAKTGQCCGGVVHLLFETLHTGPKLYLFGAGHVSQAICNSLRETVFQIHVIDERSDWIAKLPAGVIGHCTDPDTFIRKNRWDADKSFAVVLTHQHQLDEDLIKELAPLPLRYLGLIGSKSKWIRFRQRLSARGLSEGEIERVKCPIGIGNYGKAPAEIAISLGAELLEIHYAN